MALVARLLQSVPLVIALVVLAIVVYVFVAWVNPLPRVRRGASPCAWVELGIWSPASNPWRADE